MIKLSKRLKRIVEMTPRSGTVCDIGCDHAYVAISLINEGRADSVLACDINEGPLRQARRNIEEAGLEDRIELRLSDGLREIKKGEAETVICAGMGGALICRILEDRTGDFNFLVLSPQSEQHMVRRFLVENGMEIVNEELVFSDGKYYFIIAAERGETPVRGEISAAEYSYGWRLLERRDELLREYLLKEKRRYEGILKSTDKAEVRAEYKTCLEALEYYL